MILLNSKKRFWVVIAISLCLHCVNRRDTTPKPVRQLPENLKKSILFLDFVNNSSGDKLQWDGLRRAIPAIILADFSSFGTFRSIPNSERSKIIYSLTLPSKAEVEESKLQAGKLAKADYVLTGTFVENAGNISIIAKLTNVETTKIDFTLNKTGPTKNILNPPEKSIIKQTSLGLLSQMNFNIKNNELEILEKNLETTNLVAILNNYLGEMSLEEADYLSDKEGDTKEVIALEEKAKANFQNALKEDPKYFRARRNLTRIVALLPPIY